MASNPRNRYWLDKKAKRGFKGFPIATVAFYGPDNQYATKVAVGIVNKQREVLLLEKWFSKDYEDVDVRFGSVIIQKVLDFIEQQNAQTVVISEGIIGCPHEEDIDYPKGEVCPECPFWANRDRWA
jgi:hypothetical protein